MLSPELVHYIEQRILPRYEAFDKGHRRDHAESVMAESVRLAEEHHTDTQMAYVVAAYHDLGLAFDRETHHIHSGEILLADSELRRWFTEEQLLVMRDAVEDHRASSKHPPRTIYGAIVAEADRQTEPETVLRRTLQYGLKQNPTPDFEWHFERTYQHLLDKYAEGGYMRLWLHSERNETNLRRLRALIRDKEQLRSVCFRLFNQLV